MNKWISTETGIAVWMGRGLALGPLQSRPQPAELGIPWSYPAARQPQAKTKESRTMTTTSFLQDQGGHLVLTSRGCTHNHSWSPEVFWPHLDSPEGWQPEKSWGAPAPLLPTAPATLLPSPLDSSHTRLPLLPAGSTSVASPWLWCPSAQKALCGCSRASET